MSVRSLVEWVLLASGVGLELACCAGLALARDALDRVHYASAATVSGPPLIAAAVLVREGLTQPTVNALLVAVLLFVLGPVLAIETARAARIRAFGQVEARPEEHR